MFYFVWLQLLLNAGCIIDGKNDEAITPLHLATKYGKLRLVFQLNKFSGFEGGLLQLVCAVV